MDTITVYLHDIRRWTGQEERLAAGIWSQRREVAARMSGAAQLRCLAAGWLLQTVLGQEACKKLCYGEHGKPYLPQGPAFNLSHSGQLAALAVSHLPVGVDVEQWRPADYSGLARRVFHVREQEMIAQAADQQESFFRLWTAKESYIKALGGSLLTTGKTVNCLADLSPLAIRALPCPDGYSLSLCGSQDAAVQILWLPES